MQVNPAKLLPGNVAVATEVWRYAAGKVKVQYLDGERREELKKNIKTEPLRPRSWLQTIEHFAGRFESEFHKKLKESFPSPGQFKFSVQVGAIQTVPSVTLDVKAFDEAHMLDKVRHELQLSQSDKRTTIALEMEGMAIASVAVKRGINGWLIAKGVQDHARPDPGSDDKSDSYRKFAAFASALYIIEFLRRNLSLQINDLNVSNPRSTPLSTGEIGGKNSINSSFPTTSFKSQVSKVSNPYDRWSRSQDGLRFKRQDRDSEELNLSEMRFVPPVNETWVNRAFHGPGIRFNVTYILNGRAVEVVPFVSDIRRRVFLPIPKEDNGHLFVLQRHKRFGAIVSHPSVGQDYDAYFSSAGIEQR